MSINLSHSKEQYFPPGEYDIMQIPQDASEVILGDGVHPHVCDRLEAYYNAMSYEKLSHEAKSNGYSNPFYCSEAKKYTRQYIDMCAKNHNFVDKLRALKDLEWFLI